MTEKLEIREYRVEDKKRLIEILTLNVPAYFAESEVQDFSNYLDNEIEEYFVVDLEGEIIGAGGINFENDSKTGKLSWDFIEPKFQGRGIGRELLAHRVEVLKSKDRVEEISVRTSQHAYKFYKKNGFTLEEIKKDFWAIGFDMYKMTFNLAF